MSSAAVKLLCSVASNRTDLVLIDHGAEVSIHGHPKNSVGLLTVDPSVSLQGPLGDGVTNQQGFCNNLAPACLYPPFSLAALKPHNRGF